jgi:hypothetical protein
MFRCGTRAGAVAAFLVCTLVVVFAPVRSTALAPVFKGSSVLDPGDAVRNGDTAHFYAFYDSAQYAVTADFSALDGTASDPVPGTYIGDLPIDAGDPLHAWPCYAFLRTIAAANSRGDDDGILVPVTASNPLTQESVTNSVVRFCLSNHPPRHLTTRVMGDADRFTVFGVDTLYTVRNGDSLQLETTWRFHAIPFFTQADFAALDDSFAADRVYYALVAAPSDSEQTHGIYYELDERAQGSGTAALPVRIRATDGGCGRDSVTLRILIDNDPPAGTPIFRDLPAEVGVPTLPIHGVAPAGSHDLLVVLNHVTERVLDLVPVGDSLVFQDSLELQPGANHLIAYARDAVGNRSLPSTAHTVTLLNAPQFKRWTILAPDSATSEGTQVVELKNGDLIRLRSYWDSRSTYDVWADFRPVDSAAAGPELGVPTENLVVAVGDSSETWFGYQFEHVVSSANETADADGIIIPITARDTGTGYETVSEALTFCLSNHPPEHLWTRVIGDPAPFVVRDADTLYVVRNGGSIFLQTSWQSPNRPLALRADFSLVDKDYYTYPETRYLIDSLSTPTIATYGIIYNFSLNACCDEGDATYPLPVKIAVTDTGCGLSSTTVLLEMDNEGPAGSPVLNPAPPSSADAATLALRGTAPAGSFDALVKVEHLDADSSDTIALALDEGLGFQGTVNLLPGTNRIVAYGRDAVGNLSNASLTYDVELVTEAWVFELPKPMRPGDSIELASRAGWSRVTATLFNLQGDRVRTWEEQGQPLLYRASFVWDGRNGDGKAVDPGPYLLHVRGTDAGGGKREEVKALVFQR